MNDSVGGKTQVTGLAAAAVIVIVLLFLTVPLALLPIAVLAAMLINAGLSLFDLEGLRKLRHLRPRELRLSLFATLGVVTVGVLPGVLFAVGLAIIQLLARASRPHDAVLGRVPGMDVFHDVESQTGAETVPGIGHLPVRLGTAVLQRRLLQEAGQDCRRRVHHSSTLVSPRC